MVKYLTFQKFINNLQRNLKSMFEICIIKYVIKGLAISFDLNYC